MPQLVEVQDATVVHNHKRILWKVSVRADAGGFLTIIGPNGAGKTTLVRIIGGLLRPTDGIVRVEGIDPAVGCQGRRVRANIGYVPQVQPIPRDAPVRVRDVVSIGRFGQARFFGGARIEDHRAIEEAMDRVDIAHLANAPIEQLSGGERQRASIARALAQKPRLLLLDEPAAHLDPRAQRDILHLIATLHRDLKIAVIQVTHILSHISESCDQVVILSNGVVMACGSPEQTLCDEILSAAYGCPIVVTTTDGRRHFHFPCGHG